VILRLTEEKESKRSAIEGYKEPDVVQHLDEREEGFKNKHKTSRPPALSGCCAQCFIAQPLQLKATHMSNIH
jgi:hypothetical protein